MKYPLIGICGVARSGKDTLGRFIIAAIGGYHYSFADPMRAMLQAGLGIDLNAPYWQERKEDVIPALGKSPRQLMQTLGTEWGRQCVSDHIWVLLATQQLLKRGVGMVVTDVRFENEAAWVRNTGGLLVHLRRKSADAVNPHTSENGVAGVDGDRILENNGSLEDLQRQVRELFRV